MRYNTSIQIGALTREPLLYFFVVGGVLFALSAWWPATTTERIVLDDARVELLAAQWHTQMGRAPDAAEREQLLEDWLREEIYYREARRLGLDQGDIIVRRRLVQKLTFLNEDVVPDRVPSRSELMEYFRAQADRYAIPDRLSFEHRFFDDDRRTDAHGDAERALVAQVPEGDPFVLPSRFRLRSEEELAGVFGAPFVDSLRAYPPDRWSGPLRSVFGWHVVRLESRDPARLPRFADVESRVLADFLNDQRQRANDEYYAALRARHEIVRP